MTIFFLSTNYVGLFQSTKTYRIRNPQGQDVYYAEEGKDIGHN